MEGRLIEKIQRLFNKREFIDEDQVVSLMVRIRLLLETLSESDLSKYLTLFLFCNWIAHISIDKSQTGLQLLSSINDTLVKVKDYPNPNDTISEMSKTIGLNTLRKEFAHFCNRFKIAHSLTNDRIWNAIASQLIEIILDVPIMFPDVSRFSNHTKSIYNTIASNPLKPGAGVISIKLQKIEHPVFGVAPKICLYITLEDTTRIVIPFVTEL